VSTPDTFRDACISDERLNHMYEQRGGMWPVATLDELMMLVDEVKASRAPSPDSPADKPCKTCGGSGAKSHTVSVPLGAVLSARAMEMRPCPSCRGGEPT